MGSIPYVTSTGKIQPFFAKIQEVGKPETVDKKWLESIGFKGSNDSRLLGLLRGLGFVDPASRPTERWQAYRDKSWSRKVLADAIREAYADFFAMYPDANVRTGQELSNWIAANTDMHQSSIQVVVTSFKNLVELADFGDSAEQPQLTKGAQEGQGPEAHTEAPQIRFEPGFSVNINIQLTVPETENEVVYEKFFAALKKHLLERN